MIRPTATPAASASSRRISRSRRPPSRSSATRTPSNPTLLGDQLGCAARGTDRSRSAPSRRLADHRVSTFRAIPRWSHPSPSCTIAAAGTPRSIRYAADASASVNRSPWLVAAGDDDQRGEPVGPQTRTTWSSRAASCGDGRPSYCAAPITTIASTARASSDRPVDHTCQNETQVVARARRALRPACTMRRPIRRRGCDSNCTGVGSLTSPACGSGRIVGSRSAGTGISPVRAYRSPTGSWPSSASISSRSRRRCSSEGSCSSRSDIASPASGNSFLRGGQTPKRLVASRAPPSTRTAAGPTERPVTATRTGACALPSLIS